jgi:amino acid transporter
VTQAPEAGGPGDGRAPSLERVLTRRDLTAIGINQVIGSAIFLMPAQVAAVVGAWAPVAFVLAAVATLLVALCFAEVSSRFTGTGGAYLYTRTAFGPFVGFQVAWMAWFTRATSQAAVSAGLMLALGFYWPALASGAGRVATITIVTLALGAVTYRGIQQSARLVNALTVAKLVPLAIFVLAGLWHVEPARLVPHSGVSLDQALTAGLLLIFAFGGFDVIAVPAGEAADPRRDVPVAFVATIAVVATVYVLAQVVASGTLPDLAASSTPLADSAQLTIGASGALMISLGSIFAMSGNIAGQVLAGSRYLFALAEQGDLPRWFARVHPRFHTPANATIFTTVVTLALALSGSFAALAVVSAIARLLVYAGTCAATLSLRSSPAAPGVSPAGFVVPGGPIVPVAGLVVSVVVIFGATTAQLVGGGLFLLVGTALYVAARRTASPK